MIFHILLKVFLFSGEEADRYEECCPLRCTCQVGFINEMIDFRIFFFFLQVRS